QDAHRDLHSYPTRRSSDLRWRPNLGGRCAVAAWLHGESRRPELRLGREERCFLRLHDDQTHFQIPTLNMNQDQIKTAQAQLDARSEEHTSELQSLRHLV